MPFQLPVDNRAQEIEEALQSLSQLEREQIQRAAECPTTGGAIFEPLRSKAHKKGLCYKSTGFLKSDVLRLLRGQDFIVVE